MRQEMMLVLLIALLTTIVTASEVKVVRDIHGSGVRTTTAIGKVDSDQSVAEALRFLSSKAIRIGTFEIYASEEEMHRSDRQWGTDCSYAGWFASVKTKGFTGTSFRCPERTYAIKIGDSIVIRTNDAGCASKHTIVQGVKDPTSIQISGDKLQIVDFFIREGPSLHERKSMPRVVFFVQSDNAVTEEVATRFILHFEKLIPDIDKTVVLRNDRWFITTCEFPLLLSFLQPRSEVPTEEVFRRSQQVSCSLFRPWPVRCVRGL